MQPRFLVRFDDICPVMDWKSWDRIEAVLRSLGLRPILAVVPDNRDAALTVDSPRADFWVKVREWQSLGWSIGLHGYQHLYSTNVSGLVGLNNRSEFAGEPESVQAHKLDAALFIFNREGVRVDCWIAPGHSFDTTTVKLLRTRGVSVISDGYFRRAVRWLECTWVPQQLWRFRPMRGGVWTVCYHVNGLSESALARIERDLHQYRGFITTINAILAAGANEVSARDRLFALVWRALLKLKRIAD